MLWSCFYGLACLPVIHSVILFYFSLGHISDVYIAWDERVLGRTEEVFVIMIHSEYSPSNAFAVKYRLDCYANWRGRLCSCTVNHSSSTFWYKGAYVPVSYCSSTINDGIVNACSASFSFLSSQCFVDIALYGLDTGNSVQGKYGVSYGN